MPQLGELHLGGNKLTHIDAFRALHAKNIKLAGNPWHYGEELSWMGKEDMAIEREGAFLQLQLVFTEWLSLTWVNDYFSHIVYVLVVCFV